MMRPVLGGPGFSDERRWTHKYLTRAGNWEKLRGGGWINGTKSRDPFAAALTGNTSDVLQGGLLMGQETGKQTWAPSFFGALTAGIAHGATSLTVGLTHAVEIVRRRGSTGTLRIVGPPTPNGFCQEGLLTYSAVNTGTGAVTITASGQNEVQGVNIAGTVSGGTFRIGFPQADGSVIWTGTIAHNATFGTVVSNANTALDAIFGAGVVVASGASYPALVLTFTTTTNALRNVLPVLVDVASLTGATTATVSTTTPGFYGAFAVGSLIGQDDGTYLPKSFIGPGYGEMVADGATTPTGGVVPWPLIPTAMKEIVWSEIAPTVTDTGIREWIKQKLNNAGAFGAHGTGHFTFVDNYNASA